MMIFYFHLDHFTFSTHIQVFPFSFCFPIFPSPFFFFFLVFFLKSLSSTGKKFWYKYVQIISNSVWPHRRQPTRLPCLWDSPGKNTGVGCHFLLQCMKVKSESEVTQLCPTLSDLMDCSPWNAPSMGFSRQEYWSRLPLPSPMNTYFRKSMNFCPARKFWHFDYTCLTKNRMLDF